MRLAARPSTIDMYSSMTSLSMFSRASPRLACGASTSVTRSATPIRPIFGQVTRASIPSLAQALKFSSASAKDIRDHTGRFSPTRNSARP